jgi:hypothetical protein
MNDFDRFLEIELRRMLDPVAVKSPPPRRKRRGRPLLTLVTAPFELTAVAIAAVEPVAVAVPVVAPARRIS